MHTFNLMTSLIVWKNNSYHARNPLLLKNMKHYSHARTLYDKSCFFIRNFEIALGRSSPVEGFCESLRFSLIPEAFLKIENKPRSFRSHRIFLEKTTTDSCALRMAQWLHRLKMFKNSNWSLNRIHKGTYNHFWG